MSKLTWRRSSKNLTVSRENGRDGTFEWMLMRDSNTNRWHIAGQTVGLLNESFPSLAAAKAHCEQLA